MKQQVSLLLMLVMVVQTWLSLKMASSLNEFLGDYMELSLSCAATTVGNDSGM